MPLLHFSPFAARLGATLAVLGALTACTRQPAPAAPPPVLQANPLADLPAGVSQQPLPAQWWALFQDPQLNHWVQLALAHNQDLAQADATVQAMLAGIGEFDARRWPATAVEVGATYGKSADDQTLAEATDSHAPSQWQFSPGIELAYQVDVWGQVRAAIERARAQADASAAARDLVRLQVVTQTSRAYLAQCVYGARLAQARQSLQSLERSVQLSERQQQAGVATALDSERLLGLREQVRAQLPMLVARRQMALYELAMLSGQAAAAPVGDCSAIPTVSVPLPLGDGWRLLERRPDLRQAERELRAAALETEIARGPVPEGQLRRLVDLLRRSPGRPRRQPRSDVRDRPADSLAVSQPEGQSRARWQGPSIAAGAGRPLPGRGIECAEGRAPGAGGLRR